MELLIALLLGFAILRKVFSGQTPLPENRLPESHPRCEKCTRDRETANESVMLYD